MRNLDPASLIVALTGAVALVIGHFQNKRGHRSQESQQKTANRLQGQAQEFTQQEAIIANLRLDIQRKDQDADRKDRHHDAELARCIEVRAELAATLALLSEVVRDEVAKSMASMAVEKSERHTVTDH